jgi:hypothetical protein
MAKRTWGEAFPHSSCCEECGVLLRYHDPGVDVAYPSCIMCTGAPFGAVGPPETVGFVYVTDESGEALWPDDEIEEDDDTDVDDDKSGDGTDYSEEEDSVGVYEEDADSLHHAATPDYRQRRRLFDAEGEGMSQYDATNELRNYQGSARGWHQKRMAYVDAMLRHGKHGEAAELCKMHFYGEREDGRDVARRNPSLTPWG